MNNNLLKYMLSNDSNKTITKNGSNVRKIIRPLFLKVLNLGNKLDLKIEKNEMGEVNGPIIYVASHGFKDDVLNTILTVKDDTYVVFGNIDLFFNTLDGLCLWIYGTQLVDRYNKESRHAMIEKMNKMIEYDNNIIIFSEATWNLSPNKLMENLHWGFYDVAKKNNATIVPIITHKVGDKCYSSILKPIDISNYESIDIELIIKNMKKYINRILDLCSDANFCKINSVFKKLKNDIDLLYLINGDLEKLNLINNIQDKAEILVKYLSEIEIDKNNTKLINKLISRIANASKEVMVLKIRDIMATEKYELIEKYPDNSYLNNDNDMYQAWDDYLDDTIHATPYFYLELEKTTVFKDPLQDDIEDVMPWLSNDNIKVKKKIIK